MRSRLVRAVVITAINCAGLNVAAPPSAMGQSDAMVMIVNKSNAGAAGMKKADARKLLLGQTISWPGGAKVVVVLRAEHSPERIAVLHKVAGMTEADFTRFLMQVMFTGHAATTLHTEESAAAVKSYIKTNPGAVGFIHENEVGENVKAVVTIE